MAKKDESFKLCIELDEASAEKLAQIFGGQIQVEPTRTNAELIVERLTGILNEGIWDAERDRYGLRGDVPDYVKVTNQDDDSNDGEHSTPVIIQFQTKILLKSGKIAVVKASARAIATKIDAGDDIWIDGVVPGGMAAGGPTWIEAEKNYQAVFECILKDIASDVEGFPYQFVDRATTFFYEECDQDAPKWKELGGDEGIKPSIEISFEGEVHSFTMRFIPGPYQLVKPLQVDITENDDGWTASLPMPGLTTSASEWRQAVDNLRNLTWKRYEALGMIPDLTPQQFKEFKFLCSHIEDNVKKEEGQCKCKS